MIPTLLRLPDVLSRVPFSRAQVYKLIKKNEFPAPVKIGTASLWREDEVSALIEKLSAARPASQPTTT